MSQNKKTPTFEEALLRMEEISAKISEGNLSIDESISLFDEGVALAAICDEKLKNAQKKITIITDNGTGKDSSDD